VLVAGQTDLFQQLFNELALLFDRGAQFSHHQLQCVGVAGQ